jgi:hypothetical protein
VAADAGKRDGEPGQGFLAASYLMLFVGGVVLGVVGAFLLPYSVSSGTSTTSPTGGSAGLAAAHVVAAAGDGKGLGQLLSVGLAVALIANPALSLAGIWTAGTRMAALTPLAGWLLVVLPLSSTTGDGDLVMPSGPRSVAFFLLGALSFMAVAVLARPTRGMTAFNGQSLLGAGRPLPASPRARPVAGNPTGRRTAPKGGKRR